MYFQFPAPNTLLHNTCCPSIWDWPRKSRTSLTSTDFRHETIQFDCSDVPRHLLAHARGGVLDLSQYNGDETHSSSRKDDSAPGHRPPVHCYENAGRTWIYFFHRQRGMQRTVRNKGVLLNIHQPMMHSSCIWLKFDCQVLRLPLNPYVAVTKWQHHNADSVVTKHRSRHVVALRLDPRTVELCRLTVGWQKLPLARKQRSKTCEGMEVLALATLTWNSIGQ